MSVRRSDGFRVGRRPSKESKNGVIESSLSTEGLDVAIPPTPTLGCVAEREEASWLRLSLRLEKQYTSGTKGRSSNAVPRQVVTSSGNKWVFAFPLPGGV